MSYLSYSPHVQAAQFNLIHIHRQEGANPRACGELCFFSTEFTKALALSLSPPAGGNQLSAGTALKPISCEHVLLHPGVPLMNDIRLTDPPLYSSLCFDWTH